LLADALKDDPQWAERSIGQLRAQTQIHRLVINPIIYAELSLTFFAVEALDKALETMMLPVIEIPKPALFLAGKAFAQYRRQGGTKQNVLSDFFIGAHAAVSGLPLLTRDTLRYRSYFPTVKVVAPE
jgi:predicted nucleic acid-binding protein